MEYSRNFDVLMFGHFARDRVLIDGEGDWFSGGGVYFGSVALRHLGLEVGVVTRLHPGDMRYLDEMSQLGIALYAQPAPATSGIANYYDSREMERRICKPLGFAGPIQVGDLPDVQAKIYAITPIMAGEVDTAVLTVLARRGPVALDIQGFVRVPEGDVIVFRPWGEMASGLSHVTFLKADRAEAELLTGEKDLEKAARRLSSFGPREVVITESRGVTVYADGKLYRYPFVSRSLAGRTGRGDTCFSTYLGSRLSATPAEACRLAAAVTSLKQERPGPWQGTLAEAEQLAATLQPLDDSTER